MNDLILKGGVFMEKVLTKTLRMYQVKHINIRGYCFPLYLIPAWCDEDLNLFDGIIMIKTTDKTQVTILKRYRPLVSGYAARLLIMLHDNRIFVRDYRRRLTLDKPLSKVSKSDIAKIITMLQNPTEDNILAVFKN